MHGDYRLGNCLYLPDGSVSAVLDWEMSHLGDPLEDLAWALLPDWRPRAARDKVAGHLQRDEAIRVWETASGLQVDGEALDWWELFSCVKCVAIFTTGGCNYLRSPGGNLVYAARSWGQINREEARMMELMGVEK